MCRPALQSDSCHWGFTSGSGIRCWVTSGECYSARSFSSHEDGEQQKVAWAHSPTPTPFFFAVRQGKLPVIKRHPADFRLPLSSVTVCLGEWIIDTEECVALWTRILILSTFNVKDSISHSYLWLPLPCWCVCIQSEHRNFVAGQQFVTWNARGHFSWWGVGSQYARIASRGQLVSFASSMAACQTGCNEVSDDFVRSHLVTTPLPSHVGR